jgi:bifunctional non-homologous end joining protein LigD
MSVKSVAAGARRVHARRKMSVMGAASAGGDEREGVPLTNLDEPLFEGANATKRDLVDYLDGVADRLLPVLHDRALSVIRVHRGQEAFMQKNLPSYAPDWIERVTSWAESSKREVRYALCNDRRTLVWFANQRAVEYHPALTTVSSPDRVSHIVLDLDPPSAEDFSMAVRVAHLVRQALADAGLEGAVKTSGAKGVHVFVPIAGGAPAHEAAAATRALAARTERLDPTLATTAFMKEDRGGRVFVDATRAGAATVVATYSPRLRPGTPVSFPVRWDELDRVEPGDFTIHTALKLLADGDPWASTMPAAQQLPPGLVEEGMAIPGGRVQAMHEGRRRARASRS